MALAKNLMKARVNRELKERQVVRPSAIILLCESAQLAGPQPSPQMVGNLPEPLSHPAQVQS
jgi:hypothetical protein